MSNFATRYRHLNERQRQAVDTIDGPLLVVAGPGTGKTELLSMRAASILRHTDASPENILCLTFTESGAMAMRQRLRSIIGADAYRIAIHTFHSFGSEAINQYREYFYHGAQMQPIDELRSFDILHDILSELSHRNPLSRKQGEEFTYLRDVSRSISELKQAGLSRHELLQVIDADEALIDAVEPTLTEVFAGRMQLTMTGKLAPLAGHIAQLPCPELPQGITPLADSFSLSLARAIDDALASNKTTSLTTWRNRWCEKNSRGEFVMKDRKRLAKLRAVADVYQRYLDELADANLYDYDDMILELVQTMQSQPELRYNLQERYQYIMVDEFQDTNLAQLRILFALTDNPVHEGRPNIMAVGDDDQAIYSFQGADVGNIHRFRTQYRDVGLVVLTDNYRSGSNILAAARSVITQGSGRLESVIEELNKTLTAHHTPTNEAVRLYQLPNSITERQWLAQHVAQQIAGGAPASDIAIIARTHRELVALLPYLRTEGVSVNYERRDNIIELPIIQSIELIGTILNTITGGNSNDPLIANRLLPYLLAHPAFAYNSQDVWKLSLRAWHNHQSWIEAMMTTSTFRPLAIWLIELAQAAKTMPIEPLLDLIIGVPCDSGTTTTPVKIHETTDLSPDHSNTTNTDDEPIFRSPLYQYYFSDDQLQQQPDAYLTYLEAVRTLRNRLAEYTGSVTTLLLSDLLTLLNMHRQSNLPITSVRVRANTEQGHIHLLTAHKAKGLEFPHVYIYGATDTAWGRTVRTPSSMISYPENLTIAPAGSTYDERLRLFFVAMTRAQNTLHISYSQQNDSGRPTLPASFLEGVELATTTIDATDEPQVLTQQLTTDWRDRFAGDVSTRPTLRTLLQSTLEQYKLSATDLTTFLDVSRGGPTTFLVNNLLHFPREHSPHALYGTAIHHVLQRAHAHLSATGNARPIEDILGDFQSEMQRQWLSDDDYTYFTRKGIDALSVFLQQRAQTFRPEQKTELSFAGQGVVLGDARLTGTLDLVDIDHTANTIAVTDYKTGKPARSWQGRTDAEKIKLHKYRQQLMFYDLLVRHSRDYARYDFAGATLQFVEPDKDTGAIHQLSTSFSQAELDEFAQLIAAVWHCITQLQLPDTSHYPATYKGILAFEEDLLRRIEERE